MRKASVKRKSNETQINVKLSIEGKGKYKIQTPINFFTHLLENFSKHGLFDLILAAKGDVKVDQHHVVEDTGMVLGQAFKKALGNMKGIQRAGFFAFPMDEALGIVAVDIGGRPFVVFNAKFKKQRIGDFEADLAEEFLNGFSRGLRCNIAVYVPYGKNDHHKIEAVFKAFGKAMQMACSINKRAKGNVPSTKKLIDMMKD
jgi:imidazoleglycerol-phosphate dehydratase